MSTTVSELPSARTIGLYYNRNLEPSVYAHQVLTEIAALLNNRNWVLNNGQVVENDYVEYVILTKQRLSPADEDFIRSILEKAGYGCIDFARHYTNSDRLLSSCVPTTEYSLPTTGILFTVQMVHEAPNVPALPE